MTNQQGHKPFLNHPYIPIPLPTINALVSNIDILQNLPSLYRSTLKRTNNGNHYIYKSTGQHLRDECIQTPHEVDWSEFSKLMVSSAFRLSNEGGVHTGLDPSSAEEFSK